MDKKAAVEGYRLTPEMKAFQKNYGRLHKVAVMLKEKLDVKMTEAQALRQALGQVDQGMNQMLEVIPEEKVREIEGQDDAAIQKQFGINY